MKSQFVRSFTHAALSPDPEGVVWRGHDGRNGVSVGTVGLGQPRAIARTPKFPLSCSGPKRAAAVDVSRFATGEGSQEMRTEQENG